jgi:FeS assembly protein IscX
MRWTDIEDIAESLEAKHPDLDIYSLRFQMLQQLVLVLELDEFNDIIERCNERVLEAIQAEWIELRSSS